MDAVTTAAGDSSADEPLSVDAVTTAAGDADTAKVPAFFHLGGSVKITGLPY